MNSVFPLVVVVPNWNQCDQTIACVHSLLAAARGLEVRIIVVDNGSTDNCPSVLKEVFGLTVDQVLMHRNAGFASAVNAGMRRAFDDGASSVLVVNNDTVVDPGMLSALSEWGTFYQDAGILCPLIYYLDPPDRIWRIGDRNHTLLPIPFRVPDREAAKPLVEVDYATGCGMLIGREVVDSIGFFDESFFMYYEDADFCARARRKGFRIVCVTCARMWHKVSASSQNDSPSRLYWQARGQVLFYRKHGRGGLRALAHAYVAGRTGLQIARLMSRLQVSQARAAFIGWREGYQLSMN